MNLTPLNELTNLRGRTAIVTGGARGIGYGIAYRLAEAGADVVIADRDGAQAEVATKGLTDRGFSTVSVPTDVTDEDGVRELMSGTLQRFGGIDVLVNNAGVLANMRVMQMTAEDLDRVLRSNLQSVFLCTRYAAERMIQRGHGGRIINITSVDAVHPSTLGLAHYDAAKHGAWGFTKNVARELAPHRIWVNAIAPGAINTPGVAQQSSDGVPADADTAQAMQAFVDRIPMGRVGEPDDIGRTALFLASDLSSYLTGSQIVVDGGVLLT